MALITCPECGKKVSDSAEACPECGFPIKKELESGKLKDQSINTYNSTNEIETKSRDKVDNSAEISKLFDEKNEDTSAGKLSQEAIEALLKSKMNPDDEQIKPAVTVPEPLEPPPEKLTKEEIKKYIGDDVELPESFDESLDKEINEKEIMNKMEEMVGRDTVEAAQVIEEKFGVKNEEEAAVITDEAVQSFEADETEEKFNEAEKAEPQKEKKQKKEHKGRRVSLTKSLIIIVFAAIFAFAAGGVTVFYFCSPLSYTMEQKTADFAANAIQDILLKNEELYTYDAYVKTYDRHFDCMFFCAIKKDFGEAENHWYRVIVDYNGDTPAVVYYEFDKEEYDRLKNSDKAADKIKASILKYHGDEFEQNITAIEDNNPEWITVDYHRIVIKTADKATVES